MARHERTKQADAIEPGSARTDAAKDDADLRSCSAHRRRPRAPGAEARARPISTPPTPSSGTRTTSASRRSRKVNRVAMPLLKGIDLVRDILVDNTERFAKGLPANNALLWGARGMGKSSLVKAAHAAVDARHGAPQAGRDPSRGHRQPARADEPDARRALPLHRVLRRSLLRCRGYLLQVAQGGARRRRRGAARQSHLLRDVEPAPSDAARHDRQ